MELEVAGDKFRAFVPVVFYTTLKYDSVESLPYIQGMKDALGILSMEEAITLSSSPLSQVPTSSLSRANPKMSAETVKALADMLAEQYSDVKECIGVATPLSLDFVVAGKVNDGRIRGASLSVDEMGRLLDASLYVPHGKDALKADGKAHAGELMKKATAR